MNLEYVECDLCGATHFHVRYQKPDEWLWLNEFEYPVVECRVCGLVFVNPRPPFHEMAKFYPAGYHEGRDDDSHIERYRNQYEYIKSIPASAILDVGYAKGDWLEYVQQQRPDVELHGVDAFSDGVASKSIKFCRATLPSAGLKKDYFDLVTSWAVLEHVHTPGSYFKVVSEVLKPGGKFVFLVTNSESFYGKYAFKEDIPRHLYHFSVRSINAYGKKYGLSVDAISYDEKFWDGTGLGVFRHGMRRMLRLSWHDWKTGKISIFSRLLLKAASLLDIITFSFDWEARLKRSGIIVVTMTKVSNDLLAAHNIQKVS